MLRNGGFSSMSGNENDYSNFERNQSDMSRFTNFVLQKIIKEGVPFFPINYINTYNFNKQIGSGGFGDVYLGECESKLIAIKKLKFDTQMIVDFDENSTRGDQYESIKLMVEEIKTSNAINERGVPRLIGISFDEKYIYLLTEYIDGTDITNWIRDNPGLELSVKLEMMLDFLDTLTQLHDKHNIIHRDIKPENLMICQDRGFIIDFGLSRIINKTSITTKQRGTLDYSPPENVSMDEFTKISKGFDIWSMGCVFSYILSDGVKPWGKANKETLMAKLAEANENGSDLSKHIIAKSIKDVALREIIKSCFNNNPKDRPTARELFCLIKDYIDKNI